ncbi:hypothetical protein [Singulisphaera sp. PoT]
MAANPRSQLPPERSIEIEGSVSRIVPSRTGASPVTPFRQSLASVTTAV